MHLLPKWCTTESGKYCTKMSPQYSKEVDYNKYTDTKQFQETRLGNYVSAVPEHDFKRSC